MQKQTKHPKFSILTRVLARFRRFVRNYTSKPKKSLYAQTFGEFLFWLPYLTDDCRENALKSLNDAQKPSYLFGRPVDDNFNMIKFGQYANFCNSLQTKDEIAMMRDIIKVIYPYKSDRDIDKENVFDIFGWCKFAAQEIDKINKIFSSVHIEYTSQEKAAGIDELQFGVFGICDWYAKRMGITDQSLVYNETWVRIFQCMKNDTAEAEYNRRLQKVYENEAKRR